MPRRPISRFLESIAIPHLPLVLVVGQLVVLGLLLTGKLRTTEPLWLIPAEILEGEWWRLVTFLFIPPAQSPYFVAFALYLFWLYGSTLEEHWGVVRFNLFIFTGWALTAGLAFITPYSVSTNVFIGLSVFLAFARIAPNFELLLFFVLPVKVKWLALLAWLRFAYAFAAGDLSMKLAVVAATANFLLFFGRDIWMGFRQRQRRQAYAAANQKATAASSLHRCKVCGKDSETHRDLDFRYCSICTDDSCYCPDHIRNHEHVTTPPVEVKQD